MSWTTKTVKVAKWKRAEVEEIAKLKRPDRTGAEMEAAVRSMAGTGRRSGIEVEGV